VSGTLPLLDDGPTERPRSLYARTLERIERATLILMSRETELAEEFIREKEEINVQFRKSRKARLERLLGVQNTSSNVFDMINCLRRINSQATSLAYAIARDPHRVDQGDGQGRDSEGEDLWPTGGGAKPEEKNA
jgi:Na+/phosphate symporter